MLIIEDGSKSVFLFFKERDFAMAVPELSGVEQAMSIIDTNGGKGTKGDKFSEVFRNEEETINTFNDFFELKVKQAAENSRRP